MQDSLNALPFDEDIKYTRLTEINNIMTIAEKKLKYDTSSKLVLANKYVLAYIIRDCIEDFKNIPVDDIRNKYLSEPIVSAENVNSDVASVANIQTEDNTLMDGTIKYDIRCDIKIPGSDDSSRILINVESQTDFNPGYPLWKRMIYYCSRLISSQKCTTFQNNEYGKIQRVYSIWICTYPSKEYENTLLKYNMEETILEGSLKKPTPREKYDIITGYMVNLSYSSGSSKPNSILDLLLEMFHGLNLKHTREKLSNEYNIPMTEEFSKEVSAMKEYPYLLTEEQEKAAIEKGIEEGIEKGREDGILEASLENIIDVCETIYQDNMDVKTVYPFVKSSISRLKTLNIGYTDIEDYIKKDFQDKIYLLETIKKLFI